MKFTSITEAITAVLAGKIGIHEIEVEENTCQCFTCALKRRAIAQDSLAEIKRLATIAKTYLELERYVDTISKDDRVRYKAMCVEANIMGYSASARMANEYYYCITRMQNAMEAVKEELAAKQKAKQEVQPDGQEGPKATTAAPPEEVAPSVPGEVEF